ncbi:MAG: glycosyltransferase [Sulfuricurvum sp.]|jgi:glycosyltransferase involved in cell wall biosynthesis
MNDLISVIIPIYNAEKYLKKCLDSVLNQTYRDLEIILINDGSTDNSYKICQEYEKKESRIRLFTQKNRGQGFARNFGVLHSRSDLIFFIDADDYIEENAIWLLREKMLQDRSDIAIGGWEKIDEPSGKILKINPKIDADLLNSEDRVSYLFSFQFTYVPWGMIISKKIFIDNYLFFPNYFHEDLYLMPKVFYFAKKISYVDSKLYKWLERGGSSSNSFTIDHAISVGGILVDWSNFLIKEKMYKKNQTSLFQGFIKCLAFGKNQANKFSSKDDRCEILAYLENIEKNFDINFYNYSLEQTSSMDNLDLSHKLNNIYQQVSQLKRSDSRFAIYGNGIFGKLMAKELSDQIVVIFDKSLDKANGIVENPIKIDDYDFDKILICVLGREEEIVSYLKNDLNVSEHKIVTFRS